jgi:hypothetical protein
LGGAAASVEGAGPEDDVSLTEEGGEVLPVKKATYTIPTMTIAVSAAATTTALVPTPLFEAFSPGESGIFQLL